LAEEAVKKDVYWDNPYLTTSFTIGYYEIDFYEIEELKQLYTAGVIDLSIDKAVVEHKNYYWGDVSYRDHYFVDVKLTNKGKKYVFEDEIKKGRKDILEELGYDEPIEKTPGYMTDVKDVAINTLLPDPSKKQKEEKREEKHDSHSNDYSTTTYDNTSYNYNSSSSSKAYEEPTPTAYEVARDKVHRENVTVITGEMRIVKAKEVYCPEDYYKRGAGTCKIITEFTNKTPFGYVLGAPTEGVRKIETYQFKRYEDLGWVVEGNH
jgi:hypothetical protein